MRYRVIAEYFVDNVSSPIEAYHEIAFGKIYVHNISITPNAEPYDFNKFNIEEQDNEET